VVLPRYVSMLHLLVSIPRNPVWRAVDPSPATSLRRYDGEVTFLIIAHHPSLVCTIYTLSMLYKRYDSRRNGTRTENSFMTPATNPQRPLRVFEDRRVHTCGDSEWVAR
jgi:hypothetical protein